MRVLKNPGVRTITASAPSAAARLQAPSVMPHGLAPRAGNQPLLARVLLARGRNHRVGLVVIERGGLAVAAQHDQAGKRRRRVVTRVAAEGRQIEVVARKGRGHGREDAAQGSEGARKNYINCTIAD